MRVQNSFSIYKRLLSFARQYQFAFILGLVSTIISSLTDAGFTWLLKPVLDKGFIAKDEIFIKWLPLLIIFAFLIRGISSFTANYYMTLAGRNVVMKFRQTMFSHMLHLPTYFYDNSTSGQLLSTLLYNTEQVAKASTDALVTLVQETVFISGLIIVMFSISWKLTLWFMVTIPLITMVARYASMRMRKLSQHVQQSMGEITHVAEEALEGYKVIRTFGGENYENEKFINATKSNCKKEMKIVATNSLSTAIVQQVAGIAIALTLFFATSEHASVTAGGFASLLAAMLAILKPMKNITSVSSIIQRGIAAAESIFAILDAPTESKKGHIHVQKVKGHIEYKAVNFSYQTNANLVLKDINFMVEPGEKVALVGRSGSGKTTLVNLLPLFYDTYSGHITIDNKDIHDIHLKDLRNQFALVSQHVTLFNDTIAHNIAYGQFSNTRTQAIIEAAEAAHAMEFIRDLPDGLNTIIGENGVTLSGGQRQRLAIARALLKNAPLLILDEATSALDTESERHIQAALEELMKEKTTLIVAHRLSTIEKADKILVLEKGQIIEQGNHQTLLALNGHYAKLYQLQFKDC